MFTTARYFIKTAFGFFIIGLISGLYMYAARTFGFSYPFTLVQAHTHILLMGGVFMMILGVSVWFFPRARKDDKRYDPRLVSLAYWGFTAGTIIRFVSEIWSGVEPQSPAQLMGFWSSMVQVSASLILMYTLWGRIRAVGSQLREQKGEKF